MQAVEQNMEQISWNVRHPLRKSSLVVSGEIQKMYHILNPLKSFDTVAHMKTRHSKNIYTYQIRQNIIQNTSFINEDISIQDHLTVVKNNNETTVYIILSLSGRSTTFIRFLNNIEEIFLKCHENVGLIITKFSDSTDSKVVENAVKYLTSNYPWFYAKIVQLEPSLAFSRGLGLQVGAKSVPDDGAILLFMDVDMMMSKNLINTVRRNTVRNKRAYYPVVFGEFDHQKSYKGIQPPSNHFVIEDNSGFWRTYSYGMVGIYKKDFLASDGFDLSIEGWGMEDVKLVNY